MKHREAGFIVNDYGRLLVNGKARINRGGAPSFTFTLQQSENIVFLHRPLDIPDKLSL